MDSGVSWQPLVTSPVFPLSIDYIVLSEAVVLTDLSETLEAIKRTNTAILLSLQRNSNRLKDGRLIAIDIHSIIWKILKVLPHGSTFYQNQTDTLPDDPSKRDIVELAMNLLSENFPGNESGFSDTIPLSDGDAIKALKISLQDDEFFYPGSIIIPNESIIEGQRGNKKLLRDIKNELQTMFSTWMLNLISLHRKNEVKRLDFLSNFDPLTELPNRRSLFLEVLQGHDIFYLMIDLDYFKKINDMYGHPVWDIVLQEFAKTLQKVCLENWATAYRFGGEEFTVTGSWNKEHAEFVAQAILEAIQWLEIEIKDSWSSKLITLTVSIWGITNNIATEWEKWIGSLLKNADEALYVSKQHGRNQFNFYVNKYDTPASGAPKVTHAKIRQRD